MTEKISEFRRRMADGSTLVLVPHKAESAVKDSEGQTITLTYATKAELQSVEDRAQGNSASIAHLEIETRDLYDRDHDSVKLNSSTDQTIDRSITVNGSVKSKQRTYRITDNIDFSQPTTAQQSAILMDCTGYNGKMYARTRVYHETSGQNDLVLVNCPEGMEESTSLPDYRMPRIRFGTYPDGSARILIPPVRNDLASDGVVTKGWIQSTGKYRDEATGTDVDINNLVHKTANETVYGQKTFKDMQFLMNRSVMNQRVSNTAGWYKVFALNTTGRTVSRMKVSYAHQSYNGGGCGDVAIGMFANGFCKWLTHAILSNDWTANSIAICQRNSDNIFEIWVKSFGFFTYVDVSDIFVGNQQNIVAMLNVYDGVAHDAIPTDEYHGIVYGSA